MAVPQRNRPELNSQRRSGTRQGAVAVEMAITLPILFLILFASVEFGHMNVIRHTVDNAAYEAARRAILPGATAASVRTVAEQIMEAVGATGVDVQVTPASLDRRVDEVTVRVSVPFDSNGWITPVLASGSDITGQSTLRREQL